MRHLLWQIFFVSLCGSSAMAASIAKFKGTKALITLSGMAVNQGDEYYSVDASGKKRAVIKITLVRADQAVGLVTKGQVEIGQTLLLFKKATPGEDSLSKGPQRSQGWAHYGILVGYLVNKMSAKFTLNGVAKTTDMSGNGFSALGFYDYSASQKFQIRGSAGIEQFQVSESRPVADCDKGTSSTCNAIINYLSGYGIAKYNFVNGPTRAWAGGGAGVLFALSKSSTVLESSQISSNYVMTLTGGIDIDMKNGSYLPLILEYSFFPNSNSVSASYIAFRVGWGWR